MEGCAVNETRSHVRLAWHDGVDKEVLITALIGIHKKVHFRCRACHSKDPHAEYVLRVQTTLRSKGRSTILLSLSKLELEDVVL